MPVYYSYRRWSTPDQSLGDSDRRQIDGARQRAGELGAVLDDSYCDPGISGFRAKHIKKGALGRFLAARGAVSAPRLPGDYLQVEDQDRLDDGGDWRFHDLRRDYQPRHHLDIKRQLFVAQSCGDRPCC